MHLLKSNQVPSITHGNRNKHRQRRDWFARKYFSSIMRPGEFEAAFYGQAFNGLMSKALQDFFEGKASDHFR